MKREYMYIGILILSIIAVLWGIFGLINTRYNVQEAKTVNNIQNIYEDKAAVTTASREEKVSPNADFALKKYYDECSHFDYEEAELPTELVNLSRQEVEDYYSDWEIETFSADDVVLCKEVNGYCDEHFIIKLDEQTVNVYRLGSLGELIEYRKTDISRDYLPEEDIANLEEGIPVYGEGKLSSALEDYE